jgi:hypothetical protein
MSKRSRLLATAVAALALGTFAVLGSAQGRLTPSTAAIQSVSKTTSTPVHGTAYVSITHTRGETAYAAGNNYDSKLGVGAVTCALKIEAQPGTVFKLTSNRLVLYTRRGSLSGTVNATISVKTTVAKIASGTESLVKGVGSMKGDRLTARFTGTAELAKNLVIFHYKGTLVS